MDDRGHIFGEPADRGIRRILKMRFEKLQIADERRQAVVDLVADSQREPRNRRALDRSLNS